MPDTTTAAPDRADIALGTTVDGILVTRDGAIVTVTINRPDKMNALDLAAWRRLGVVLTALDADESLRCIIFRGAGGKAFAAGADISAFERERGSVEAAKLYGATFEGTLKTAGACRHPTIALIEGVCVGGGLELASTLDMRICGTSSRFGVPIKLLGLTMGYAELSALLNLVGPAAAKEILLEGAIFGSDRAKDLGLVNRVVADDAVEAEVLATAKRIADGAPLVARWHKKFISRLQQPAPLTPDEIDEGYAAMGTEDFKIGVAAFLAKSKPKFTGR